MIETKVAPLTIADAARIAESIRTAAKIGEQLKACGLNRRAVVLLLANATSVTQRDVNLILNALGDLGKLYLR